LLKQPVKDKQMTKVICFDITPTHRRWKGVTRGPWLP